MHDNDGEHGIREAKAHARRALVELVKRIDNPTDVDQATLDLANLYQVGPDKLELVMEVCALLGLVVLTSHALDITTLAAHWKRVEGARAHLKTGTQVAPLGEQERRAAVLRHVEQFVERLYAKRERDPAGSILIDLLTAHDVRYRELETAFVDGNLRKTKPRSVVGKGGATNVAPALCAARLSVKVHAFDDHNEQNSKKAFLAAQTKHASKPSPGS